MVLMPNTSKFYGVCNSVPPLMYVAAQMNTSQNVCTLGLGIEKKISFCVPTRAYLIKRQEKQQPVSHIYEKFQVPTTEAIHWRLQ